MMGILDYSRFFMVRRRRWETVFGYSPAFNSNDHQILSNLFNAPNLGRIYMMHSPLADIRLFRPNAASGNIRHLCLHYASPGGIRPTPAISPRLETLDVCKLISRCMGYEESAGYVFMLTLLLGTCLRLYSVDFIFPRCKK